jgi:hypothetical protein
MIAASPTGRLTQKIGRQPPEETIVPPTIGPSAIEIPNTAPQTPTACARSRGSAAGRGARRSPAPRADLNDQSSIVVPTVLITNASGIRAAMRWTARHPVQCAGTRRDGESAASASIVGSMIGSNIGPLR